jgi:hypothetical protein
MSNYTGPVMIVTFVGPRDRFALTIHSRVDDPTALNQIAARYEEDGYKPDLRPGKVRKAYMSNGTLEPRETLPVIGFRPMSAHLRA